MTGVILAGGAGTRLWPASRAYWPKFLLKFGEHTLLQESFLRLRAAIPAEKIFIVANVEHKYAVKENIRALDAKFPEENIVCEPCGRNTLAAAALAAAVSSAKFGDEPLAVCPSDHLIKNKKAFSAALKKAAASTLDGKILTLGVRPSRAETGYGYIKRGSAISRGVFKAAAFVEKPSRAVAERFLASAAYFWNAGIFIFKPSTIFAEIKKYLPAYWREISTLAAGKNIDAAVEKAYPRLPSVSIDYGIMEKSSKVAILPFAAGWDDLGDWNSASRVYPAGARGNIIVGKAKILDTSGTTIIGSNRFVGAIGLKDTVIVDTPDALLVASKKSSQKVRELVAALRGSEETLRPKIVPRPWGEYDVIAVGDGYKVKIINVLPGKKLSLQKHRRRSETWLVVSGAASVVKNGRRLTVKTGSMVEIPVNTTHRLENATAAPLEVLEVSRGGYINEDDIIRIEDDFQRR